MVPLRWGVGAVGAGSVPGGAAGGACFGVLRLGEGRVSSRDYVDRGEVPIAGTTCGQNSSLGAQSAVGALPSRWVAVAAPGSWEFVRRGSSCRDPKYPNDQKCTFRSDAVVDSVSDVDATHTAGTTAVEAPKSLKQIFSKGQNFAATEQSRQDQGRVPSPQH
jgi:hypothetical protein